MPVDLQETRLPGIGVKYALPLDDGGRVTVILHNDGLREIYWFRRGDDDPRAVIRLDDDEARQLGAVLGGGHGRPHRREGQDEEGPHHRTTIVPRIPPVGEPCTLQK